MTVQSLQISSASSRELTALALLVVFVVANAVAPMLSVVMLVALVAVTPWIIWQSLKFNARMTSYRNVRFGFDGKWTKPYLYLYLVPLLPAFAGLLLAGIAGVLGFKGAATVLVALSVLATYLTGPWVQKLFTAYLFNASRYGTARFSAPLRTASYYWIYLKTALFMLGMGFLFISFCSLSFALLIVSGTVSSDALGSNVPGPAALGEVLVNAQGDGLAVTLITAAMMLLFGLTFLVKAFLQVRVRDYSLGLLSLDGRVRAMSTLRTLPYCWLMIVNFMILLNTLWLGLPWVRVRTARFLAAHTELYARESLDGFVATEVERQASLAEELGDMFDVGIDVGV